MNRHLIRPLNIEQAANDHFESECVEDMLGYELNPGSAIVEWAMSAVRTRDRQASPRAVFHRLGHTVPIAIAAFAALYFAAEFLR